ncbi:MAG: thioredoxin domain-containing protein [Bacteroidales bacterium]|nr:thioredoxin domain-containing protein [Bacteroidales bacterium]
MKSQESDKEYFRQNNLNKSSSPYLLQHTANPIWWQEWSSDAIHYAVAENKPIFVSVGYATCHWCHVMAAEAFSDEATATCLNNNFVSIKVDREQRPDIDQFMMDFINKQNGRGGWPLNVFLTPELRPIFALTYAPAASGNSLYSFLSVVEQVVAYFKTKGNKIPEFVCMEELPAFADENSLTETISKYYDSDFGGFGNGQKFPSHSTLLYLLYQAGIDNSPSIRTMVIKTLDAMYLGGLNDHLQGGIYRYCTDREWTIPHFEKMLYDQAMALWVYSLAFKVTQKAEYKEMAERIIHCLDDSFEQEGLYISAHDADTDHEEGATYIWSYDELTTILLPDELERFSASYYITRQGNFEGHNHLIRKNKASVRDIEDKLLSLRRKRIQPSRDEKVVSGINALVAISLIHAGRLLSKPDYEKKAALIVNNIMNRFWDGTSLGHSFFDGKLQNQSFLSDAGALLLAIAMLCEADNQYTKLMNQFKAYVESFRDGSKWIESESNDFPRVYSSWFDHPVPSGISLAEMGLTYVSIISGEEITGREYLQPFQSDFYNINVMMNNGFFHIITSKKPIPWNELPANSFQIRGEHETDCYMGTCSPL